MITAEQMAQVRATFPAWDDMTIRRHLQQRAALGTMNPRPRFSMTYCSQCGRENGPGDAGTSDCRQHRWAR